MCFPWKIQRPTPEERRVPGLFKDDFPPPNLFTRLFNNVPVATQESEWECKLFGRCLDIYSRALLFPPSKTLVLRLVPPNLQPRPSKRGSASLKLSQTKVPHEPHECGGSSTFFSLRWFFTISPKESKSQIRCTEAAIRGHPQKPFYTPRFHHDVHDLPPDRLIESPTNTPMMCRVFP